MTEPSRIIVGDVLEGLARLPESSVHCCVTSPPYWGLRDYGVDGQIGLEPTPEAFVAKMVEVFRGVRRVLRDDGTLWLNLGDCYAGSGRGGYEGRESTIDGSTEGQSSSRAARLKMQKPGKNSRVNGENHPKTPRRAGLHAGVVDAGGIGRLWVPPPDGLKNKDLCMMPWRVALALQADGWWVRSVVCWFKKSPMPESCRDRPTSAWEPIFLLAKSGSYYFYDAEAVKEKSESTGGAAFGKVDRLEEATAAGQGARRYERPDYRLLGRNMRNVWHLSSEPYPEAHFATFPSEIPRRAIKAGTSEKGCCEKCGAPWARVVDGGAGRGSYHDHGNDLGEGMSQAKPNSLNGRAFYEALAENPKRTVGWKAGCGCNAGVVPCVVLDPFLGSGTTVAVARELGRHGVGVELNPEYARLARERIGRAERPATFRADRVEEAPLFAAGEYNEKYPGGRTHEGEGGAMNSNRLGEPQ